MKRTLHVINSILCVALMGLDVDLYHCLGHTDRIGVCYVSDRRVAAERRNIFRRERSGF